MQAPEQLGTQVGHQLAYQMSDEEMVAWVGDCPIYMVDYFTITVTPKYLVLSREEFQIPDDINLVVPSSDDCLIVLRPNTSRCQWSSSGWSPLTDSPIFEADAPKTQLSPVVPKCQHISDTDKLFHSLGQVFLYRAPIQYLLETLSDEGSSYSNEMLLPPGLPGDIHCWLP